MCHCLTTGRSRLPGPLGTCHFPGSDPVADAVDKALTAAEAGLWKVPVSGDVEDWVLLADRNCGVRNYGSATSTG